MERLSRITIPSVEVRVEVSPVRLFFFTTFSIINYGNFLERLLSKIVPTYLHRYRECSLYQPNINEIKFLLAEFRPISPDSVFKPHQYVNHYQF